MHGLTDLFIHLFIYSFIQITYGIHCVCIYIYMQHTVRSILQTLCTKAVTPALGILAAARPLEVNDGNLG